MQVNIQSVGTTQNLSVYNRIFDNIISAIMHQINMQ